MWKRENSFRQHEAGAAQRSRPNVERQKGARRQQPVASSDGGVGAAHSGFSAWKTIGHFSL